jgi:hypothetical protein
MRPTGALIVAAVITALLPVTPAIADPPAGRVAYRAPVPGPVIDPFRPPDTPYGPGNRGIDYATTPGEEVVAPAEGEVTFAGAVAGGLHVVLLHADGIRTSLSFLAAVLVRRGQWVAAGTAVGLAASSVHFGARRGAAYLDPASLLTGGSRGDRAVLVPEGAGRPLGAGDEADGLRGLLAGDGPASPSAPSVATATAATTSRSARLPLANGDQGSAAPGPSARSGPAVARAAAGGGPIHAASRR